MTWWIAVGVVFSHIGVFACGLVAGIRIALDQNPYLRKRFGGPPCRICGATD